MAFTGKTYVIPLFAMGPVGKATCETNFLVSALGINYLLVWIVTPYHASNNYSICTCQEGPLVPPEDDNNNQATSTPRLIQQINRQPVIRHPCRGGLHFLPDFSDSTSTGVLVCSRCRVGRQRIPP